MKVLLDAYAFIWPENIHIQSKPQGKSDGPQLCNPQNTHGRLYLTRSRIELFQKAESIMLATHQEQTYVLYECCSGNLQ